MASLVIVEAEQDRIDLRLPLQQLQHRLNGGAAAGHIAVALPALRMERDVGEHIDGSFEHIEAPICADVVEAVAGIAALHIEPEGFAEAVGAALVGMAGDAVFIRTHENRIVVIGVFIASWDAGKSSGTMTGLPLRFMKSWIMPFLPSEPPVPADTDPPGLPPSVPPDLLCRHRRYSRGQ